MEMTKNSLEIVNAHIELFEKCRQAYIKASDIETANEYKKDIETFKCIKQDLERLEQLEKENQELKEEENRLCIEAGKLFYENAKLKKAIKLLKPILDIYAGEGKGYIDCCVENPIMTLDLYNDKEFKLYNLFKEVLGNE